MTPRTCAALLLLASIPATPFRVDAKGSDASEATRMVARAVPLTAPVGDAREGRATLASLRDTEHGRHLGMFVVASENERLVLEGSPDSVIVDHLAGSERTAFAASVSTDADGNVRLPSLTPREASQLRSLLLDGWSEEVEALVSRTDPARCVYVVGSGALVRVGTDHRRASGDSAPLGLPPLRRDTRHLIISLGSTTSAESYDWRGLWRLQRLETLAVRSVPEFRIFDLPRRARHLRELHVARPFWDGSQDLRALPAYSALRTLSLAHFDEFESLAPLARLDRLESLELLHCTGALSLEPLGHLERLKAVRLAGSSGIRSLEPLAELPQLEEVDATGLLLHELPAREWPQLHRLRLLSATTPDGAVDALRSANPDCVVEADWRDVLLAHVDGADLVRVRTGGTCHRRPEEEDVFLELRGAEASALVNAIDVALPPSDESIEGAVARVFERFDANGDDVLTGDGVADGENIPINARDLPEASDGITREGLRAVGEWWLSQRDECTCCGGPSIEILRGDERLATLGVQHGHALRWVDHWPGDAPLTDDSIAALRSIVEPHGPWPAD